MKKLLRENVLSRMLLHMVESSGPIDTTRSRAGGYFTVQNMQNHAGVVFKNIQNPGILQHARIRRLSP
jgi:hypothetical protein